MAQTVHSLKVKIETETIQEIKRAIIDDIACTVEQAYKEGYVDMDPGAADADKMQAAWEKSDVKKQLDNFRNS